jgi:hypothetical protein
MEGSCRNAKVRIPDVDSELAQLRRCQGNPRISRQRSIACEARQLCSYCYDFKAMKESR